MAKTKNENKSLKMQDFEEALKELDSKYNSTGIASFPIAKMSDIGKYKVETISTGSLVLDNILGGGVGKGRIVEIYGAESCGKTTLSLTIIANVQKAGGTALFLDVEQAFDPTYARKVGVDVDNLGFVQPIIAEQTLGLVADACKSGKIDIIVVDSVAAMVPKAEFEKGIEGVTVGELARVMSRGLKQIALYANKTNTTVIFLNQTREDIGSFIKKVTTPGGKALKFAASQRIEVKKRETVKGKNQTLVGNQVKFKITKNKIAPPYMEGLTVFRWDIGVDIVGEIATVGEEIGIIQKEGRTSYYTRTPEQMKIDETTFIGDEFESKIMEDGRIKIATSKDNLLKELKRNKVLFDMLAEVAMFQLKEKQKDSRLFDDKGQMIVEEEESEEILSEDETEK